MKRILQFAFLLVAMILLSAGAFAQSIASAQLSGTVKDPKGAVVPGASGGAPRILLELRQMGWPWPGELVLS